MRDELNTTSDALFTLISKEDVAALGALLETEDVDLRAKNRFGNSPLHHACRVHDRGNIEIVRLLLRYRVEFEAKGIDGLTPLAYAVSVDNVDIAKLLIECGAEVNAVDNHGNTILLNTVGQFYNRHPEDEALIRLLLEHGADPSIKNNHGNGVDVTLAMPYREPIRYLFEDYITK